MKEPLADAPCENGYGTAGEGAGNGVLGFDTVLKRFSCGKREDFDTFGASDLSTRHDDDGGIATATQNKRTGIGAGDGGVGRQIFAFGPRGEGVEAHPFGEEEDSAGGIGACDAGSEGQEERVDVVRWVDVDVRVDE